MKGKAIVFTRPCCKTSCKDQKFGDLLCFSGDTSDGCCPYYLIVLLLLFTSDAVLFLPHLLLSVLRHLSLENCTEFELMMLVNKENENSTFFYDSGSATCDKTACVLFSN